MLAAIGAFIAEVGEFFVSGFQFLKFIIEELSSFVQLVKNYFDFFFDVMEQICPPSIFFMVGAIVLVCSVLRVVGRSD